MLSIEGPTRYTIVQNITPEGRRSCSHPLSQSDHDARSPTFSVVYRFLHGNVEIEQPPVYESHTTDFVCDQVSRIYSVSSI